MKYQRLNVKDQGLESDRNCPAWIILRYKPADSVYKVKWLL